MSATRRVGGPLGLWVSGSLDAFAGAMPEEGVGKRRSPPTVTAFYPAGPGLETAVPLPSLREDNPKLPPIYFRRGVE